MFVYLSYGMPAIALLYIRFLIHVAYASAWELNDFGKTAVRIIHFAMFHKDLVLTLDWIHVGAFWSNFNVLYPLSCVPRLHIIIGKFATAIR